MTDLAADQNARIDALEIHLTHQDRLISELNDVVAAQWRKIDVLERQIGHLRAALEMGGQHRDGPEPPPPHY